MKNLRHLIPVAFVASVVALIMLVPTESFGQGKTKEQTLAAFPQPVSGIFGNSCVGCHNDMSKGKAKEFMNFSEWDKLTAKDKKKTSKSIAKMVKKGVMPPAGFLEKAPQAALTAEQTKCIIDWAVAVKKGKQNF
jgi:cytochrome c5